MRITVGNIKGGVAKTTTAVFLALGLAKDGSRVLLVDADPEQASALGWSEAASDDWPENCSVVAVSTRDLAKRVRGLSEGYDHLVIDTGPKNPLLLKQALSITDTLIVPVAPQPMELREVMATFDFAEEVAAIHPIESKVLLVRVRSGTRSSREVYELLEELKLPVMGAVTHLKETYSLAFGTVPCEAGEYDDVLEELT